MAIHLHDTLNYLRKLTARRLWNIIKVTASYYYARLSGKPVQWGLPVSIAVEPTTACNLRCPECPSGLRAFTRPTGHLSKDFFRTLLHDIGDDLSVMIFYFQGEPYINPAFLDMVAEASAKGIYTITSTNGHFLDDANARKTIESGLDRLIISIDGTTQDVYEQYRREGSLDTVLDGARNVVAWKRKLNSRTPHIIFQYLVVRPNEHQIDDARRLARAIGVDEIKFKTAQIYDYTHGNPLIPTIEKYSRYRKRHDGRYELKQKPANHCWRLWHAPVVTWDGIVVPCCFDKDARHRLGDIKQVSFRQIWQNPAYRDFRHKILRGRRHIDICQNCTEGVRVWG